MSRGDVTENDLAKLYYQATPIANIADNAASSPITSIHIALHSANPGETGDQTTNEIAYTGYARVAVVRSSAGWSVVNNTVSPVADIVFPQATGGTATATFFSTGVASSGASKIIDFGPIGAIQGPFTGAVDDNITIPGHTMSVDHRVAFFASYDSVLPVGLTEGTVYWVKTVSGNQITVSTTQGGTAVDITGVGDGYAVRITPIEITSGTTPKLGTATIIKFD